MPNDNWITPRKYIEMVERVMGSIDLDPAASLRSIQEEHYPMVKKGYGIQPGEDGLKCNWYGNIWLNPPYSRSFIGNFVEKACAYSDKIHANNLENHIMILVNNSTETAWFQKLLYHFEMVCFFNHRIKFIDPDDEGRDHPRQGQALFYAGATSHKFLFTFSKIGTIITLPFLRYRI